MADPLLLPPRRYGAIEAGGTKIVCGIGDARHGSLETTTVATADPETTLARIADFFAGAVERHGALTALGVASFGPLELDRRSPHFGRITTTPKAGWRDFDIRGRLGTLLAVPVAIDTDVNAAAAAERQSAPDRAARLAYVTVGTGIGVGFADSGGAAVNAEAGHLLPRRHPAHDGFAGVCPYHGDCLEGLASGPAIAAAWGAPLSALAPDHIAWTVEADYLGQLCATLILTTVPGRIVLGGGVMAQARLLPMVRAQTLRRLGDYVAALAGPAAVEQLIVAPASHEPPGLIGAYLLAEGAES